MLKVVATAVWWLVQVQLSEESRSSITPEKIARTLPGYVPGEAD